LEKKIDVAKAELTAELSGLARLIVELESRAKELPRLIENDIQLQAALDVLSQKEEKLNRQKQAVAGAEADIRNLIATNERVQAEIKEVQGKLEMLQKGTENCPLCGQELDIEDKKRVEENYRLQVKEKTEAYERNQEEIQLKRKMQQTLKNEVAAKEQGLKMELSSKRKELTILSGKVHSAREAEKQRREKEEKRREIEDLLAAGSYALQEQKLLSELAARHQAVGYDSALHNKVRDRLKEMARYEGLKRALDEAKASLSQERALLSRTERDKEEKNLIKEDKVKSRSALTTVPS
jgi:DNA repair exonuclease SbcCD ATPase subunit